MIEQHRHCAVCGTPIPMSETVCSETCQQELNIRQGKAKRSRYILYGIFVLFIVVWVLYTLKII